MVDIIELLITDYFYHLVFVFLIILFLIGLKIRSKSKKRLKNEYKVDGKEAYSDLSGTETSDIIKNPLLTMRDIGLTGKPDKVMVKGNKAKVWEYKSKEAPKRPYFSHKLQLACYAVLIEHEYDLTVNEGVIKYKNSEGFTIKISDKLKRRVIDRIKRMRAVKKGAQPVRNHNNSAKCAACSYREICRKSLT